MNTDEICGALAATLSPDVTQRKTAEAYLNGCKRTAGFPVVLLQLARPPAPGAWPLPWSTPPRPQVQQHCATPTAQSPVIRSTARASRVPSPRRRAV